MNYQLYNLSKQHRKDILITGTSLNHEISSKKLKAREINFRGHKLGKSDSFSGRIEHQNAFKQNSRSNIPRRSTFNLAPFSQEFSMIELRKARKPPPDTISLDSCNVCVNGQARQCVNLVKESSSGYSTNLNSSSASDVSSLTDELKATDLFQKNPVLPELPPKDYNGDFIAVRPDIMEDEADQMEKILLSIEPEDLYIYTLARLNNRDPTVIDALKKLLPAMKFQSENSDDDIPFDNNVTDDHESEEIGEFRNLLRKKKHNSLKINSHSSHVAEREHGKIKRSTTTSDFRKKSNTIVKKHCIRCHKNFNANSDSNCEKRCQLQHPEDMVVRKKHTSDGTDFKCLACGKNFYLPNADYYEEGVSSILTGFCFVGTHTTDPENVVFVDEGGAAKTCEANGCVEFYV